MRLRRSAASAKLGKGPVKTPDYQPKGDSRKDADKTAASALPVPVGAELADGALPLSVVSGVVAAE